MFDIKSDKITLPYLEQEQAMPEQWEIYSRFFRHMRHVPISRMEIKILSSVQFCADMMYSSDAYIAKELVEMGLRAPRIAFPLEFLDYVDRASLRCGFDIGAPSDAIMQLLKQWSSDKEQLKLTSFRHVHSIVKELV